MHKKLTITIDEDVYNGLYESVGAGKISKFIETLLRPHVLHKELETAYRNMAKDRAREKEADLWCESVIGDLDDEKR